MWVQLSLADAPVHSLLGLRAGEKGFNEDRVRNQVKKINAAKGKASQGRLESFFGPVTVKPNEKKAAKEAAAKAAAKGGKGGSKGGLAAKGGVKKAPIASGKKK
jgi:flap endonuclease-1